MPGTLLEPPCAQGQQCQYWPRTAVLCSCFGVWRTAGDTRALPCPYVVWHVHGICLGGHLSRTVGGARMTEQQLP